MVGILNLARNGTNWIYAIKSKVVVVGTASMFLAVSLSSLSLSSLILSFKGENARGSSLLLEVAELCLASRWVLKSSSLFRPSQSNTLRDGLRAFLVGSFSQDFSGASGLGGQLEAVLFWGQDVPTLSRFLLLDVAEWVDSAYDWENCCEFVWRVKVALPRVVVFANCCSTRCPSAVV